MTGSCLKQAINFCNIVVTIDTEKTEHPWMGCRCIMDHMWTGTDFTACQTGEQTGGMDRKKLKYNIKICIVDFMQRAKEKNSCKGYLTNSMASVFSRPRPDDSLNEDIW